MYFHHQLYREDIAYLTQLPIDWTRIDAYLESIIKALEKWRTEQKELDVFKSIHFCYTFMPKLVTETGKMIPFSALCEQPGDIGRVQFLDTVARRVEHLRRGCREIGRASCRERV